MAANCTRRSEHWFRLAGLPPENRHENELESVTERRRTDAGESVQRGTNHRDLARAGSGREDAGGMPAAWDLGRDLLQVESQVRRAGGFGGPATAIVGG